MTGKIIGFLYLLKIPFLFVTNRRFKLFPDLSGYSKPVHKLVAKDDDYVSDDESLCLECTVCDRVVKIEINFDIVVLSEGNSLVIHSYNANIVSKYFNSKLVFEDFVSGLFEDDS